MKELEKTYNPADIEDRLYQKWLDNKYFHADAERGRREGKKPFTIVMPPPNITGQLHMGHAAGYPDPLQENAGLRGTLAAGY